MCEAKEIAIRSAEFSPIRIMSESSTLSDYSLHKLGWKAFQDLCVAIVEEQTSRPVQTFLATQDAGRDGAFRGRWDQTTEGDSTIQCKFTSRPGKPLSAAMLSDEVEKARKLALKGLAQDYIILTNHTVTGASELKIRHIFEAIGVKRCYVYHRDWILTRIRDSARLRMMVPRLYGLMDLTAFMDDRAYKQARLILTKMGDNLQKLVVTEAHKNAVRAISAHNLVLLLGAPAAGKSTIGASLALGANDSWGCATIKSTSSSHLEKHVDPDSKQFFWIDDAWGSTQYQRDRTEGWNQLFPLIQAAIKKGSRFLITSRDYIWRSAQKELKLSALPVLGKSQVVIDVSDLSTQEKAQILYNHIKLGDQSSAFKAKTKSILPEIAKLDGFLPESARRFGNNFFTEDLSLTAAKVIDFFENPTVFLEQTIDNLSAACQAAVALLFLNGGKIRSPVPFDSLNSAAKPFGTSAADVSNELHALNGSLLHLAEDEDGPFWSYRHPSVGDAFASHVAKRPQLVEIYLRGAKPETLLQEIVCAGITLFGAKVVVPVSMHGLLLDRIGNLPNHLLGTFISYRSNARFSQALLTVRPDIWKRLDTFWTPLKDDSDVDLLVTLYRQGLLPESRRIDFVSEIARAAVENADDSFIDSPDIASVLTDDERQEILERVEQEVLREPDWHISKLRAEWSSDYDPETYFENFRSSIKNFVNALSHRLDLKDPYKKADALIDAAVRDMHSTYEPEAPREQPIQQSKSRVDSLEELFRDIDV